MQKHCSEQTTSSHAMISTAITAGRKMFRQPGKPWAI
jgi:hypothetical protein